MTGVRSQENFLDQMRLDGKVAIVTGAGRGLGKDIALSLASVGADVALMARTRSQLEATAREIEALGRRALAIPVDISRSENINPAVEQVTQGLGPVDILVNNAGVGGEEKPFLQMTDDDWHRIMGVNLNGVIYLCRAVGKQMVERKRGKVINIGSVMGLVGFHFLTSYCTSKAALLHFTRSLALEWARYGINVNAIALGWFPTEMTAEVMAQEKIRDSLLRGIPLRRFGQLSEVGPLAVYLASPASDFMTGSVIVMDGGQLTK